VNVPDIAEPRLPRAVAALVDGAGLAGKIGPTIVLTAVDGDGWPRQALLSVGEVLSVSGKDVRLALYAGSRTTRALASSGRALLTVAAGEAMYKVCVEVARVGSGDGLAFFAGRVVAVDGDKVGYARVTSGITYELPDPQPVLQRWARQIDQLRAVAP
jgi:hypothetical protein